MSDVTERFRTGLYLLDSDNVNSLTSPALDFQRLLAKSKRVKQSRCRPESDPEGSRKLRFPDYMTTAQDGGKVVSPTHRPPLPPGNTPGTHFC